MTPDETRREEMRKKCEEFHREHPEVWELFTRFAFDRIGKGFSNYGAKAIMERVRWETNVGGDGTTELKIGNNHTAFYSRRFAKMYPEHADFFRFRVQTSAYNPATGKPDPTPWELT